MKTLLSTEACVHCGRPMGDQAGGYATFHGHSVCHPNDRNRPDCYHMVNLYQHPLFDCERCKPAD